MNSEAGVNHFRIVYWRLVFIYAKLIRPKLSKFVISLLYILILCLKIEDIIDSMVIGLLAKCLTKCQTIKM